MYAIQNVSRLRGNVDTYGGMEINFYPTSETVAQYVHYHDYYEIIIYLGDTPATFIHKETAAKRPVHMGDILLIDIFDGHMLDARGNEQSARFSVGISPEYIKLCSANSVSLKNLFSRSNKGYPVFRPSMWEFQKYVNLIQQYRSSSFEKADIVYKQGIVHQMLAFLYEDFYHDGKESIVDDQKAHIVRETIGYIHEHISEDLRLDKIAAKMQYSKQHLASIFKEITHTTLNSYIAEKRITTAIAMMKNGPIPLTEVAEKIGFLNYSTFFKAFKKVTGVSPKEYISYPMDRG
ncbi:AraC family transcriptional regulator [Selenomonas sp. TAMA-11512]|uniref:helix-turn-helix transcriptional regulator n=1 Tax=Selenomonas sp. TAMA-11512 TaxID=3095337 RepID=UPI00308F8F15|nr:AraC family transcriptional regulator [Selenomonas sp. TAMA-11512]